jgi:hypothetical protein
MRGLMLAMVIAGAAAMPALAMDDTMSCHDFMMMDHEAQVDAMQPGEDAMMAAGSMEESAEDKAMSAMEDCTAHPDKTVGEAMMGSQ